ncbi:YciI family protein [Paracoccus suum]|uniref:YciI family protein n=1 Tax=Paracoccus suum TaxID=2259340 RepID=A0A344PIE6_9RHOB|nr:YciI family protein [Paracoccus suum]AXC49151.1 YciI family protein [Paracoccus suum]
MPLYAIICKDRADALQTRLDNRQAHLDYIAETGIVVMAGPLMQSGEMRGSLVIVEATELASAKAWSAGDPYLAAGLFDTVEVIEWKKVIG